MELKTSDSLDVTRKALLRNVILRYTFIFICYSFLYFFEIVIIFNDGVDFMSLRVSVCSCHAL